jgi:integrase
MRPSEQLGLRWQDVNMENGLIFVQHGLTWNRKGGGYVLGGLKTANSQRCIKLRPSTIQALKKHRSAQQQERLALGSGYENNDLVFATTIGTPLQPRNVIGRHLKPLLCKAFCPETHETGPDHRVRTRIQARKSERTIRIGKY